jgi:hypothetical protein
MRYSKQIKEIVEDLLTTHDTKRILAYIKEKYPKDTSRATFISSIRFHCLQDIRTSVRLPEELVRASTLIDNQELTDKWIHPLAKCTIHEIQQVQKQAYMNKYSYDERVDRIVNAMDVIPSYLREFRAFIPYSKESQIDKDSSRVLQIKYPARMMECIRDILCDCKNARSISDTVLALCVATGRRTMEILATGSFEPMAEHEHILLFTGQVKCNGYMKPYPIPCLFPSDMIISAHNHIRYQCNMNAPVSSTSQGDCVRYTLHQRYSSQLNKRCKKRFTEFINGDFHVHDLRGLYALFAFHMSKDMDMTFPRFAQCILGHCSQHISLHYNRFRISNMDELPSLDLQNFHFSPSQSEFFSQYNIVKEDIDENVKT